MCFVNKYLNTPEKRDQFKKDAANYTEKELSEKYGITLAFVYRVLKKYNKEEDVKTPLEIKKERDNNVLKDQENGMKIEDILSKYNISYSCFYSIISKTYKEKEARINALNISRVGVDNKSNRNKEIYRDINSGKTSSYIAKKYNISLSRACFFIKKQKGKTYGKALTDAQEKELCNLYLSKTLTRAQLAEKYNMSNSGVSKLLYRHNIAKRTNKKKDEIINLNITNIKRPLYSSGSVSYKLKGKVIYIYIGKLKGTIEYWDDIFSETCTTYLGYERASLEFKQIKASYRALKLYLQEMGEDLPGLK